ncbi:hypothetical protein KP509_02G086900 [Ceratopteris richardii]|uniref:Anaphase-promoting complex subunit 4 WD40 domain-containing protein n=1 Tax=Ceratopteris richardii TaxID=49495 RepID=A0A8T2VBT0_CERRI|nr:hypothetical protein KP509_02G086900 [Ceratopteris richardii]
MFVYFNKKVSMPGGTRLRSLAWNSQQGWLACGGDNGLLKVLKLPSPGSSGDNETKKDPFIAAQSNLSMNQTLEGHQGSVLVVRWNECYRKLTSSDDRGLIIVWTLHKVSNLIPVDFTQSSSACLGLWFEEMVNNRSKCVVKDIKWASNGQKVCIIYEDGQVIVGNVDGNRIWGKDLKLKLANVEWSPDGRLLLFGTKDGKCNIYDHYGNFLSRLHICFDTKGEISTIMGIDWFAKSEGYDSRVPTLAIALSNGKIQMMRHEVDEEPVLIDTKMNITCIKWSPNGEVLGVVGSWKPEIPVNAEIQLNVQLYSHDGIHLRTLNVPGKRISTLAWDGGGLKLALAVDSYIYLANIRPEYKWAFFGGCVCVYGYEKKGTDDHCIMFWDTNTGKRNAKFFKGLIRISGSDEYCTLATMGTEPGQFILSICNAFGQCVATRSTNVEPQFMTMNKEFVFVSSDSMVCSWNYRSSIEPYLSGKLLTSDSKSAVTDYSQTFHLDNHVRLAPIQGKDNATKQNVDQISCVCSSEVYVMIGRDSGILHRFILPDLKLESTDLLQCRPQAMELNCTCTRLAVIDMDGILKFYDLKASTKRKSESESGLTCLNFERKDVWNMKWADDNSELLAVMEKSRMYIIRGTELEEPVSCTAYLCTFHALQILAIQLDEIMQQPEFPGKQHLFFYETKSLRDTHQIIEAAQLHDAFLYIEEHSHPKLWIALAEAALQKLDLSIAERAFVKCKNYFGIQFSKKVHSLKDAYEQKAEVCTYFKRFDEAERLLLQNKRVDLAMNLDIKFGRWAALERLVISNVEDELQLTYDSMGKFFLDRQNWKEAKKFYERSKNYACIAYCLQKLGDWKTLDGLMKSLKKGDPLLLYMANQFWSVGMCKEAVAAFTKHGSTMESIECCLDLNMWKMAYELGQKYDQESFVNDSFNQYIEYLLKIGNYTLAIEASEAAQQNILAAKLLKAFADKLRDKQVSSQILKQVYVLMALNIGKWKTSARSLKVNDSSMESVIERPWHYAEAYHLWACVHQHLYMNDFEDAFRASIFLSEYEDILDVHKLYSLQAVASYYAKKMDYCISAFKKLEEINFSQINTKENMMSLAKLVVGDSFQPKPFKDMEAICKECKSYFQVKDKKCPTCDTEYFVCVGSSCLILDEEFVTCDTCYHALRWKLAMNLHHCPLCHADLKNCKVSKPMSKFQRRKSLR